jgi:virginiamycin A acetyltransferase
MQLSTMVKAVTFLCGYPKPLRYVLNKSGKVSVDMADSADVKRKSWLRGDIQLAEDVTVGTGCRLNGSITVERGTNLNRNTAVHGEVHIGQYCAIAPDVRLHQPNHTMARPAVQTELYNEVTGEELPRDSDGPIEIGHDVWIGARAIVLGGVTVGTGAAVGAGAVVTDDVDPYTIVAGVPAETVGRRFSEPVADRLLEEAWWEWGDVERCANAEFFRESPEDRYSR